MNQVADIKTGDDFVFRQVFEEYHEKLFFFILGKTHSRYLAEEVTQITFIKLWQNRDKLDEQLSISIQLFRVAKTSLIDLLRKQNNFSIAINGLKISADSSFEHVQAAVEGRETNQKYLQVINEMPPMRKKVFELSRLEGKSYKDIAQELSISTKTVEKHISKALKQLKMQMDIGP